jgi:hypothetical protein
MSQSVDYPIIRSAGGIVPDLPGSFPDLLRNRADEIRQNRNDSRDVFDHASGALPIPDRRPLTDPSGDGGGGLPVAEILIGLAVVAVFSYGTGQLFTFEVGS